MVDGTQGQSPTPSNGGEGTDLRSVARDIEGLLDSDGHFNPGGAKSRAHPDYDENADPRAEAPDRDERGRFKAADASDEGDEPEELVEQELDAAAGDESDADADAGDTDETLAESADSEAETGEEETAPIETLSELAEALEMSPEDFNEKLTHTFNAAGEEVTVTLAELVKGYQKDADYRRGTAKLAEQRQAQEQEHRGRLQAYEQQNHVLAGTLQMAEQLIAAELQSPRLAELRESDPAEWTARREEIGQRLGALQQTRMQAAQAYDAHMTGLRQSLREREQDALLSALPDFGAEHRDLAKATMGELGYSDAEISEVMDHRIIVGVLELANLRKEVAALRELKAKAVETTKRVKKEIPKLTKPGKGKRKTQAGIQRSNLAKLKKRANASGSVKDAAAVIEQLI